NSKNVKSVDFTAIDEVKRSSSSIISEQSNENKSASIEIIRQFIKIKGRLSSSENHIHPRADIWFGISTLDESGISEGLLKTKFHSLGNATTGKLGEFNAEFSYEKPVDREDKLIVNYGFFISRREEGKSEMPVRFRSYSKGKLSVYSFEQLAHLNYAKTFDITENPMELDINLNCHQMSELSLNIRFKDMKPAFNFPVNMFVDAKQNEGNFNYWPGDYKEGYFTQSYTIPFSGTGIYKLWFPAEVRFQLIINLSGYNGKTFEAKLSYDTTNYLEVLFEKVEGWFIGKCIDEDGNPLGGVEIRGSQSDIGFSATTKQDGSFNLDLKDQEEKINLYAVTIDGREARYFDISPMEVKVIVLKKKKSYKVYYFVPEEFMNKFSVYRAKIEVRNGEKETGHDAGLSKSDSNSAQLMSTETFATGEVKFRFLLFDDISLDWTLYYEATVEITAETQGEFTVKAIKW
ncbi:MAG: hypothetical protein HY606_04095, partial [Planctomycetes bacterium]|nr:hypothetical protein [Planctomycetota bacterium]